MSDRRTAPDDATGSARPDPNAEIDPDPVLDLNDGQRRRIAASLRHAADLLERAERLLVASRSESPLSNVTTDLTSEQTEAAIGEIASIRRRLAEAARGIGVDLAPEIVNARHAALVQTMFASIDLDDIRAKNIRGYGEIGPETACRIDALADELETSLRRLTDALSPGRGASD